MNNRLEEFKKQVKGKRISVIGMGVSNIPLVRLLLDAGAEVVARDRKEKIVEEIRELGVELILGDGYLENLDEEYIFKTPGMRFDVPELERARAGGSIVTSEMELFFELCPAKIFGVTGSDGKTTTTTLIGEMLARCGKVWIGGNIGKPLIGEIENIGADDRVVVELSSFQLHTMRKSPQVAVVTNVSPNHLDMHKSMEEYIEAKENIFRFQAPGDRLVLNYDNEITRGFQGKARGDVIGFSMQSIGEGMVYQRDGEIFVNDGIGMKNVMKISDIRLPGMHNVENYMAAIGAVWGICGSEIITEIARNFGGVEHRIEFVRERNGVKYYNDSIASSPTRARAGLYSFDDKVVLIAGGYDKKIPFDEFGRDVVTRVKRLILLGATADAIQSAVENAPGYAESDLEIVRCESLEGAVEAAAGAAENGDVVLFSPACASFDMFENFAVRGQKFKELVNLL